MLTLDQINRLNAWWTDPAWAPGTDLHLIAAAAAAFTWDPRPFDAADLASGAVFTLRGPRQRVASRICWKSSDGTGSLARVG